MTTDGGRDIMQKRHSALKLNKKPTNWWGMQNAAPLKFDPKPSDATFSAVFSNFKKCRPEVANDVISGVAVD